jgi:hypothetical protein
MTRAVSSLLLMALLLSALQPLILLSAGCRDDSLHESVNRRLREQREQREREAQAREQVRKRHLQQQQEQQQEHEQTLARLRTIRIAGFVVLSCVAVGGLVWSQAGQRGPLGGSWWAGLFRDRGGASHGIHPQASGPRRVIDLTPGPPPRHPPPPQPTQANPPSPPQQPQPRRQQQHHHRDPRQANPSRRSRQPQSRQPPHPRRHAPPSRH